MLGAPNNQRFLSMLVKEMVYWHVAVGKKHVTELIEGDLRWITDLYLCWKVNHLDESTSFLCKTVEYTTVLGIEGDSSEQKEQYTQGDLETNNDRIVPRKMIIHF